MITKSTTRWYDFPAGCYCGVFMPEYVMKKIAKLGAKHADDVRKVLEEHKADLLPSHWTLVYPNDKQTTVRYSITDDGMAAEIENRVSLFEAPKPTYYGDVFLVDTHDEAREIQL